MRNPANLSNLPNINIDAAVGFNISDTVTAQMRLDDMDDMDDMDDRISANLSPRIASISS